MANDLDSIGADSLSASAAHVLATRAHLARHPAKYLRLCLPLPRLPLPPINSSSGHFPSFLPIFA